MYWVLVGLTVLAGWLSLLLVVLTVTRVPG